MNYFISLQELLKIEKDEDRQTYKSLLQTQPVAHRRENGFTWYPVAIRDSELGRGDYLTIELERTTHHEIIHQFRFGVTAALFSNHDHKNDRIEGTVSHISGNKIKLTLRTDELPDWSKNGKLGIDLVFDENSYAEMEKALKAASALLENNKEGHLAQVLTGLKRTTFTNIQAEKFANLNTEQQNAINKIVAANELAIVHGPPGTGKTTTLVEAIKHLRKKENEKILVVAPSNAAVDLLSEKLHDAGLKVLRVGNPARVSEKQLSLTLDSMMAAHPGMKEIRRLKKQAAEYRDLAHKYKRNFGAAEREQRKALFTEAKNIAREVEKTEEYIADDLISKSHVITATLIGANHYTVRNLKYKTLVIDEAGQALEPACWVAILKAGKVIMAGDHCQLPPTIKSQAAYQGGLGKTLMEKLVALHPDSVVLLKEQYRMHSKIMDFSSQEFYHSSLTAHDSVADRKLFENDDPFVFIDTAGCGFEEKIEGSGICNPEEASFLLNHLEKYLLEIAPHATLPSVAVISPYRHQVELLKELINSYSFFTENKNRISVNTIDSFQGQERDIVYISLTRSNPDNVIGFLSEVRRMNVAMTRARKKLVMFGDSATLSKFNFYADLISYADKINGYKSAWEFMT